jgi:hypothetical protein
MLILISSYHDHLSKLLKQLPILKGVTFIDELHPLNSEAYNNASYGPDYLLKLRNILVQIIDEANSFNIIVNSNISTLAKPTRVDELSKSILSAFNEAYYKLDGVKFYVWKKLLSTSDSTISLTAKEAAILEHMLLAVPKEVAKKDLLREIWGYNNQTKTATVEAHIYRLRHKLITSGCRTNIISVDNSYYVDIKEY